MESNPDFGWWEEEDELDNEVEDWEMQDQEDVELVKCLAAIAIDMNQDSDKLIWPVYEVPHEAQG